jgi:hypothetical protein
LAADGRLDFVQLTDAIQRLASQWRGMGLVQVEPLAAHVRPTSDFQDTRRHAGFARHKERLKARVRVHLQLALEAGQMLLWIFSMPTR